MDPRSVVRGRAREASRSGGLRRIFQPLGASLTAILGINAYHGDSAACLLVDGRVVAAAEEERFNRVKHWAGFPRQAIEYCLSEGSVKASQLTHVAINRNPRASLLHKALFTLRRRPPLAVLRDRFRNAVAWAGIRDTLREAFPDQEIRASIRHVEHHLAHVASSYLMSPFDQAALLSVDGFGDFTSTLFAVGRGPAIDCLRRVHFPSSLGVFYEAVTQHLGFPNYGDEYKVMGLAPYGEPTYLAAMRSIVSRTNGGRFVLDMQFFRHGKEDLGYSWNDRAPGVRRLFTGAVDELLGAPRDPAAPIEQAHRDVAKSLQSRYEEVFWNLLRWLHRITGLRAVCLSGGCAMNSVANGKVVAETPYRYVYIPPAPGDSGGAVGAAAYIWTSVTGRRPEPMRSAFLGPQYSSEYVASLLSRHSKAFETAGICVRRIDRWEEMCGETADWISQGLVVGWFQGRMEWGPRALGNRSILCDPRRADMKEILNRKIKRRESFRPFAPSILREAVSDYFEIDGDVPFMSQVFKVRSEKRSQIAAVVHVDGTGRLQTVSRDDNPLYWALIDAFRTRTGIPMVLNTSFNENEPIVERPEQALGCFLRTSMDALVLLDYALVRSSAPGVSRTN